MEGERHGVGVGEGERGRGRRGGGERGGAGAGEGAEGPQDLPACFLWSQDSFKVSHERCLRVCFDEVDVRIRTRGLLLSQQPLSGP